MNVGGLDLSLTSTGMFTKDGAHTLNTPANKIDGAARLVSVRDDVLEFMSRENVTLVTVEGYGHAKYRAELIGELGGVVRVALWEAGVSYIEVPPATLKKFATGKGNASKDEVLVQAVIRSGIQFKGNDEADAFWLCVIGWQLLGEPILKMPVLNIRSLDKLVLPELVHA